MSRAAAAASTRATLAVAALARTRRATPDAGAATAAAACGAGPLRPRARSASSVAPLASQSSMARASSAAASALAARSAQRRGQREAGVGVIEEAVGGGGEVDCGAREIHRGVVFAAPRQRFGAYAAPGDGGFDVVAGQCLAVAAERFRFCGAILREQCAAEQRGRLRRVDAQAVPAQAFVGGAQAALGRDRVAFDELDQAGVDVRLAEPLRDAELLDHVARRGDHAPRRVDCARAAIRARPDSATRPPRPPARPG